MVEGQYGTVCGSPGLREVRIPHLGSQMIIICKSSIVHDYTANTWITSTVKSHAHTYIIWHTVYKSADLYLIEHYLPLEEVSRSITTLLKSLPEEIFLLSASVIGGGISLSTSGDSYLNPKPLSYCLPSLFSSCFVFELLCSFLSLLCFLNSLLFDRRLCLDIFPSTLSA